MSYKETREKFLRMLPWRAALALGAMDLLLNGCGTKVGSSTPRLPKPDVSPIPVPKEVDPRAFTIRNIDFTIKDSIGPADAQAIRSLCERAHPLLVDLFGVDLDGCNPDQRAAVYIKLMDPEEAKTAKGKGNSKTYTDRIEINLIDPKDQLVALHEFIHLFMPSGSEFDTTQEGFPVTGVMIVGEQLGLIKSVDEVTLRYIGGFYEAEPFLEQNIAAISYDAYLPLAELRYLAAGSAWLALYQANPKAFKQLCQFYGQEICHGLYTRNFYERMGQLYPNLESIMAAHPILKMPELGKHLSFTLIGRGESFTVCLYDFRQQGDGVYIDAPVQNESLTYNIEYRDNKGVIVYRDSQEATTDVNGVYILFYLPRELGFETTMVNPKDRTSRLVITVKTKSGLTKKIELNILPQEIQVKPTGHLFSNSFQIA